MILILIQKEFILELRRKAVITGIGLYLTSITFICYLTFKLGKLGISEATWSALFWLIVLFSVINSVGKSFIGEKKGVSIYHYSIASPHLIIISKIIYNTLLTLVLSVVGFVLFSLFISNPIQDMPLFLLTLFLTSCGLSAALTLMSAIAAKANNSNVLMAVLSFPIIIAILLMAIRVTKNVSDGLERNTSFDELLNLFAINCILTALAYILFPYIWRS
ncbi:MAG: heme exporter protein CcmB [Chryseolinea sp.]